MSVIEEDINRVALAHKAYILTPVFTQFVKLD